MIFYFQVQVIQLGWQGSWAEGQNEELLSIAVGNR